MSDDFSFDMQYRKICAWLGFEPRPSDSAYVDTQGDISPELRSIQAWLHTGSVGNAGRTTEFHAGDKRPHSAI